MSRYIIYPNNYIRATINSDIESIIIFINIINKITQQYKKYYSNFLAKFKNLIIFDEKTQKLYNTKFNEININFSIFIHNNILDLIKYANNIFNKYNIEKKINFFNTLNFSYKEYIWHERISDFTIKYILWDLNILLNYLLQRLIKYKTYSNITILGERKNDILLLQNIMMLR
jgi:hypothetical protein